MGLSAVCLARTAALAGMIGLLCAAADAYASAQLKPRCVVLCCAVLCCRAVMVAAP